MKGRVSVAAVGLLLGFSLSRIGFSSWDEVHSMFTFHDLRLFLTFCCGVVLLAVAWEVVRRVWAPRVGIRPIHPGTLPGGVVFGLGWALCGACPAVALVQLGEGQAGGLFTLAGILAGNWIYASVHERFFRWSPGVCLDP
ncbi:MAG: YeeE/YedE thiosulfate transporter family protein [Polyangiaceae bacterium]